MLGEVENRGMKQRDGEMAKEGQDSLAMALIGKEGFFVDLGMGHPMNGNNTILLERAGWTGMCFEIDMGSCDACNKMRVTAAFCHDVARESIKQILDVNHAPKVIDFISFDVDGGTLKAIELFPFEHYEFKVMCFEHDSYGKDFRKQYAMVERLSPWDEYYRFAQDVCFEDGNGNLHPWEDWWLNAKYLPCHGSVIPGLPWWEVLAALAS